MLVPPRKLEAIRFHWERSQVEWKSDDETCRDSFFHHPSSLKCPKNDRMTMKGLLSREALLKTFCRRNSSDTIHLVTFHVSHASQIASYKQLQTPLCTAYHSLYIYISNTIHPALKFRHCRDSCHALENFSSPRLYNCGSNHRL